MTMMVILGLSLLINDYFFFENPGKHEKVGNGKGSENNSNRKAFCTAFLLSIPGWASTRLVGPKS